MGCWSSSSYVVFAIHCLVLCFISIGFTRGVEGHRHRCTSSSCGDIEIRYPFRLKGDPTSCGDPNYELTCSSGDNRTLMEFSSIEYLVKQIDYSKKLIQIVDVGLLDSNCSFPFKFLPSASIGMPYDSRYGYQPQTYVPYFQLPPYYLQVSIIKCSKKHTFQRLQLYPCQAANDSSYVYGVIGKQVADLAPSCSFLSWVPTTFYFMDPIPEDIFNAARGGFFLSWVKSGPVKLYWSKYFLACLRQSSRVFQDNFKTSNVLTFLSAVFKAEKEFPKCMIPVWDSDFGGMFREGNVFPVSVAVILNIVLIVVNLAAVCRFVFAPLSLCFFLAHKIWSNWAQDDAVEKFLRTQQSLSPTRYAYADIIAITRNFRERLGKGGFGAVYKGELPGRHFIAVKMLAENSKFNGDDFINEVSTIGRIHHINVVRLLGFCSDGSKRALVYEYMPMGSLEKYIFSADKTTPNRYFSWKKLNSIALGVARGINYLHRGCDMTILHFDIKPQNILLDHRFRPKISDFGLAKLYPKEHDMVSVSFARGTIGYIAPELVSRSFGLISHKSDVYSFGMLLLEMGAGRRNVDNNIGRSSQAYNPSLIYDRLCKSIINISISINEKEEGIEIEESSEMSEVEKKLYIVGFWCIQIRPSDRPSMSDIVQMLEGDADALQMPPKPFFSSSPSISITSHSEITATVKKLPAIDEDDNSQTKAANSSIMELLQHI